VVELLVLVLVIQLFRYPWVMVGVCPNYHCILSGRSHGGSSIFLMERHSFVLNFDGSYDCLLIYCERKTLNHGYLSDKRTGFLFPPLLASVGTVIVCWNDPVFFFAMFMGRDGP
jgi:hypothetical protein